MKLEWQEWPSTHTWQDAMDGVKNNESGWRLPTRIELIQLYDSREMMSDKYFWSSDTYLNEAKQAWVVNFWHGRTFEVYKAHDSYVRLVREVPENIDEHIAQNYSYDVPRQLTPREEFTKAAMQGLLSNSGCNMLDDHTIAAYAFLAADAIITELERTK